MDKRRAAACLLLLILPSCGNRPPPLEAGLAAAQEHLTAGHAGQAINELAALKIHYPRHPAVWEKLAFAYAEQEEAARAGRCFSRAAELDPAGAAYRLYAAQSFINAAELTAAVKQYQKYLEARPEEAGAWQALAELLEKMGRPGEAVNAWLRSHRLRPRADTACRAGRLFLGLGNLPQARVWFQTALEADSGTAPQALLGLFETALRQKDFAEAENLVEKLETKCPGTLEGSPLASAKEDLRRWRESRNILEEKLAE